MLHGVDTMCTHIQMIVRNASVDAQNKLIFYDFVSFIISQDPLWPFFEKRFENFENSKKVNFSLRHQRVPPLDRNRKKFKNWFFFQIIILFCPESEFYMFLLMYITQILQKIFKFSSFSAKKIFVNDQLHSWPHCGKKNHPKWLFLVSMDN